MLRYNMNDTVQQALGFLVSQISYLEPLVYKVQYPDILYRQLIPIDTSAPEWAPVSPSSAPTSSVRPRGSITWLMMCRSAMFAATVSSMASKWPASATDIRFRSLAS